MKLTYLLAPADMTLTDVCAVVLVTLAAAVLAMVFLHVFRHWNDCLCTGEAEGEGDGDGGPEGEPPGHPQAL